MIRRHNAPSLTEPRKRKDEMPRLIGILGGMGPAATLDLQAKILAQTDAARDQDHIPTVVWNVPQIPDRPAAVAGGPSPLPAMIEGAQALQQVGASAIAMPCNTAHYWAEPLQAALDIPLLHIVDACVAELPADPGMLAILGTRVTLGASFYQQRLADRGIRHLVPQEPEQAQLLAAIQAVKSGQTEQGRPLFQSAAKKLLATGATRLVLACTELPLLSPGSGFEAQCIDPTAALARACIRHALS